MRAWLCSSRAWLSSYARSACATLLLYMESSFCISDASLQAHVEQLEAQLALRAAEAEESDTRMLEVLKENKRLTAKNRSLQAELQGLRTAAASAAPAGKPEAAPAAAAPKQASPVRRPILHDRTNTPGRKTEPEAANKPEAAARPARPEAPVRPKPESRFMDRLARFKPVG